LFQNRKNHEWTKSDNVILVSLFFLSRASLASFQRKEQSEKTLARTSKLNFLHKSLGISVTNKKLPNVYKSYPKMISQEKLQILTPSQKMPKNEGDLGK